MEKSCIGRYGVLITLVVVMNVPMAWGKSNDAVVADGSLHAEMTPAINEMAAGCGASVNPEYRHGNDVTERRASTTGVMVAEDMRCRQCRGKCKAENLRCRSQCAGEGPCLAICEERSSQCETMCTQVFRCE